MVIRHPLVEDHYKNITQQTSTIIFFYPLCIQTKAHQTSKWSNSWKSEFEILIFILNSSTFHTIYIPPFIKQHRSMCASYTDFDELILFISSLNWTKAFLNVTNCFTWTVKCTLTWDYSSRCTDCRSVCCSWHNLLFPVRFNNINNININAHKCTAAIVHFVETCKLFQNSWCKRFYIIKY